MLPHPFRPIYIHALVTFFARFGGRGWSPLASKTIILARHPFLDLVHLPYPLISLSS